MFNNKSVAAIIVAAGRGTRMSSEEPKQFMKIAGKTILETTLHKFEKSSLIDKIVLVINIKDYVYVKDIIAIKYEKIFKIVAGGKTRTQSVYEGIKAVEDCEIVLIHDGVRPFVSYNLINSCIENAYKYKACIPVIDLTDTIKRVNDCFVEGTLDRSALKAVQTPQAFDYELLRECYDKAVLEEENKFTDDSSILEYYGYKVKTIEGLAKNFKITTPFDLKIAEIIASIY